MDSVDLTIDGMPHDREVHVRNQRGVLTARTRHGLLRLSATATSDGCILVDGSPWDSPEAQSKVIRATGEHVELVRYSGSERFDVLPLLVTTDAAIDALGYDGRRLRPNIVIGGARDLEERSWPGQTLRIGSALIGVLKLRARCIVTTIDPDDGSQNLDVLRRINREFGGRYALDCWVARPGHIRVDDAVELVAETFAPPAPGGWIVGAPYNVP